jgi:hypothetical protein
MTIRPKKEVDVNKIVYSRGARIMVGEGGTHPHCHHTQLQGYVQCGDGLRDIGRRRREHRLLLDIRIKRFSLEACADGLVDVIEASTVVIVYSGVLTNIDKAMLFLQLIPNIFTEANSI